MYSCKTTKTLLYSLLIPHSMKYAIVHYDEIGLKKGNRDVFEKTLMSNLSKSLKKLVTSVKKERGHILLNLNDEHYRKIDLIKTTGDKPYYDNENGYWRLMSYIDKTTTYNTTSDSNIAFEAGRIIGKFHQLMEGVHQGDYVDTIPNFHNLEFRKKQFISANAVADSAKLDIAKDAIIFAEEIWDPNV